MAKTKCPTCGYTESDGRASDRETYYETCSVCAAKAAPVVRDPRAWARVAAEGRKWA